MEQMKRLLILNEVIKKGSMSKAAESLGMTASAVSLHLQHLERHYGLKLLNRSTRRWGVLWLLLGIPVAWSRIYLGVHYPMDMVGAFAISLLAASAVRILPLHTANRLIETAYRRLLAYPIKKGWLPE